MQPHRLAARAPAATYGHVYRNAIISSAGQRQFVTRAIDDSVAQNFEPACTTDLAAPQPHFGSKLLGEAMSGSTDLRVSQEDLESAASRALDAATAAAERIGATDVNEFREKLKFPSSIDVSSIPSMPSLPSLPSLPSMPSLPSLPSMPSLPEGQATIVARAKDTYNSAFDSTQNVLADRVGRLSTDLSAIADRINSDIASKGNITPASVQRAATKVVDDLHAIRGALDDHNLVSVPTVNAAVEHLQHGVDPHFGTEIVSSLVKASGADILVLLSELSRFIGMSRAVQFVIEIFV